mgnify:CR=1 FL=1
MLTTFPQCNFRLEFPYLCAKIMNAFIDCIFLELQNDAFWDTFEHALLQLSNFVCQKLEAH